MTPMFHDNDWHDDDRYADYEAAFDATPRHERKRKANHKPKKSDNDIINDAGGSDALKSRDDMTYRPSLFEEGWLLDSVRPFYDRGLIRDILINIKGGKEASVYCCEAQPETGASLFAAKVYRPQMFRNLRNDAMYREGREVLTAEGKAVKATDQRIMRALGKKSSFGAQVAHTSWLMYEFNTLKRLYEAGATVPKPYAAGENAILMTYVGGDTIAAPLLHDVRLQRDEAKPLLYEVIRNIDLMLRMGYVHGDLSAFNILYWEGTITLIDFPQVTNLHTNRNAYPILERDVTRVCEYFARFGIRADAVQIARAMWDRYAALTERERAKSDEMWLFGREFAAWLDTE